MPDRPNREDRSKIHSESAGSRSHQTIRILTISVLVLLAFVAVPPVEYAPVASQAGGVSNLGLAAADAPDEGLEDIHEQGVTGEGVKVGIVGATFGPQGTLAEGVVDKKVVYDPEYQPNSGVQDDHDAQVANIVAGTAPQSDLYLAEVGNAPTAKTYTEAIKWLVESDVDVIVDAGSYAPRDTRDRSVFGWTAEYADSEGVLFVTSAGNYANKHWVGHAAGPGWISFSSTTEANQVGDGPIEGQVSIRMYWNGDDRFDLYLFKHREGTEDVVVASDVSSSGVAAIDATVPRGSYYVSIRAPEEPAETQRIRLFSLQHPLAITDARGSMLEPATSQSVLAVGATRSESDGLRRDSSRTRVTLAGPGSVTTSNGEIVGTSAAAPYVAGTAALLKSADDSLSPSETREILAETGDKNGNTVVVDPETAVSAVEPKRSLSQQNDGKTDDPRSDGN